MVEIEIKPLAKDTIVINVSSPPATRKTTLCRALSSSLSKYGIRVSYVSFTGFHNFSYLFSRVLYLIFKVLGKTSPLCRNPSSIAKIHPYDCIPLEYEIALIKLIYMLETLSLHYKVLGILSGIAIFRPRVVLLDEGFPHIILNYIMFFHTRKSRLYRHLNRLVARILKMFSRYFDEFVIIQVLPIENKAIDYWTRRDPYLPRSLITGWIKAYYIFMPTVIKLLEGVTSRKIIVFNNMEEAYRYTLSFLNTKNVLP